MRLLLLYLLAPAFLPAQSWPALRPIQVASGLRSVTDIQNAADGSGRLFLVEQEGRILVHRNGVVLPAPFLDVANRVRSGGERGLLGLAFPPGFAQKQYFYVNYTEGSNAPDLRTVVARYRVRADDPDRADPDSEQRILVVNQPFDNHNAGQLAFSPKDGFLYVALGDGGSGNDPLNSGQNPGVLLGKMLRLDVESGVEPYLVPASNPFVSRPPYRSEIWATGLRNPWRFSFDSLTGGLWIADVGQSRFEEVNFQPASSNGGENYGWKTMEGNSCVTAGCNQQGLTLPVFQYGRSEGISVTGGYVYRGDVHNDWTGHYFLADFGSGRFWSLRRNGGETESRMVFESNWNVSTFGVDERGEIYFARYDSSGAVYRLAGETPALNPKGPVNAASGEPGVTPGGRLVIDGWGVSSQPGFVYAAQLADRSLAGFTVWFDEVPGRIAELYNLGGREAAVVVAPDSLESDTVAVSLERDGKRSNPVNVPVYRAMPGLFTGVLSDAAAGSEITLLATGTGPFTPAGACSLPLELRLSGTPVELLDCQRSSDFAGVAALRLRLPAGLVGEQQVTVAVDGRTSPPLTLTLR